MTGDLFINGKDAYTTWGIYPEKGALAALMTPAPMKSYISNATPLTHGETVADAAVALPKVDKRTVQIPLVLAAPNETLFFSRYSSFMNELRGGKVDVSTRYESGVVYHMFYLSCSTFAQYNGTLAKFSLKLNEPNPMNRNANH